MSVISRIESMMEDYSSAEKKLANYIIGNIEKVPTKKSVFKVWRTSKSRFQQNYRLESMKVLVI